MKLVKREDKVLFIETTEQTPKIVRLTGFTELSVSKNPSEYSRRYVDEAFEQADVTGYSPEMSFAFDQYTGNVGQQEFVDIIDGEKLGSDAVRTFYFVDLTVAGTQSGSFVCKKRDFSIIADAEGDSTDAYTYGGSLKVKSNTVIGTATSSDNWQTITFTEAPSA